MEVENIFDAVFIPTWNESILPIAIILLVPFAIAQLKGCFISNDSILQSQKQIRLGAIWIAAFFFNYIIVSIPGRFDDLSAGPSQAEYMRQTTSRNIFSVPNHKIVHWESIFKPAGYVFIIWALIYLGELAITILAFLVFTNYVTAPTPQKISSISDNGVIYWVTGNIMQGVWCLMFRPFFKSYLWLSNIVVLIAFVNFAMLHLEVSSIIAESKKTAEKVLLRLFRFPIALHTGWLLVAYLLGTNAWVAVAKEPIVYQYTIAHASAYSSLAAGLVILYVTEDPTISFAISWGMFGVSQETAAVPHTSLDSTANDALALTCSLIARAIALVSALISVLYCLPIPTMWRDAWKSRVDGAKSSAAKE